MIKKTPAYTAGEMRNVIEIQTPTDAPDGSGGVVRTWATKIAELWCCAEEMSGGRERYNDKSEGRVREFRRMRFTTWFRDDITLEDRIVYNGKMMNISNDTNLVERRKFLELIAEAGVET